MNSMPGMLLMLFFTCLMSNSVAADNQHASGLLKGKEPIYDNSGNNTSFPVIDIQPVNTQCLEKCIRRNQMASVGFHVIQEQCRRECDLDNALALLNSQEAGEYARGVKELCAIDNPRTVQPLITALERDLKERTGLWAWIIPALGASRDKNAVPVLIITLTEMDEFWLGREMSARALGALGDPAAVPYLLAAAWRGDTREAAIEALAQYRDERVIPVLISALSPEEEQQTREVAIAGLEKLGSMAVPELIQSFSEVSPEHPETQKRLWLCRLLAASGDERAMDVLRRSRTDPDEAVRECAVKYAGTR